MNRLNRATRLAVVAAAVALGAAGCSQGNLSQEDLEEALDEGVAAANMEGDFSAGQLECIADTIFDEFDEETINEIGRETDTADLDPTVLERVREIVDGCLDPQATTTTEGAGDTTTTEG